jgi:hypothetical protein
MFPRLTAIAMEQRWPGAAWESDSVTTMSHAAQGEVNASGGFTGGPTEMRRSGG